MDDILKSIALGKLWEFLRRINETTTKEDALSVVGNLKIPNKCKEKILRQLVTRGIIMAPAPVAWMHFDPKTAINFAMEEIRKCKEEV